DERSQVVKAVGGDQSGSDQFPKPGLDFRFQLAGAAHDVGEKRRTALPKKREHVACAMTQAACLLLDGFGTAGRHPVRLLAHKEGDGRNAGGNDAAATIARILEGGGMRRETSPADGAGETELIELLGIVFRKAAGQ